MKLGFRPPLTRGTHLLPLASRSPADFERLCYGLVCREGLSRVEHVGAAGRDDGCDIVAFRRGRRVVFQCKRSEKLGPKGTELIVGEILALPRDEWPVDARRRARAGAGTTPSGPGTPILRDLPHLAEPLGRLGRTRADTREHETNGRRG